MGEAKKKELLDWLREMERRIEVVKLDVAKQQDALGPDELDAVLDINRHLSVAVTRVAMAADALAEIPARAGGNA